MTAGTDEKPLSRVRLSMLPAYYYSCHRTLQFSDCNYRHLDNVAVLKFCSDAQQLFYHACLGGVGSLQELSWWCAQQRNESDADLEMDDLDIFNGDAAIQYVAEGHRYDRVTIDVGLVGYSNRSIRVAFRLSAERPILPRTSAPNGATLPTRRIVLALAEIGCVVVNRGRPVVRMPSRMRAAFESVLQDQRQMQAAIQNSEIASKAML
ncbi:hypothetical protein BC832DRAFT_594027 [Gaertneriomyces semiglobifer]|nr:hypothetical protein BC832DRAFT_594027 [Gaertneriomyces semiglobifer]